ncbi:hypothetical protein SDC9_20210 [bioreactor metagenome]|uniref:Uncharacterized protein n=1 Tax=bioreactor metagenome TaxID=1076179 RepID=A0A644U645_9ZZZZ
MSEVLVDEEVVVGFVQVIEETSVDVLKIEEEEEFPNRYGLNGKSPFIGENGRWYVFDDIVRQFVDTGINATDEELKRRVSDVEADLQELLSEPDEIQQFANYLSFPNLGNEKVLYIDIETSKSYRWDPDILKYFEVNQLNIEIINGGN